MVYEWMYNNRRPLQLLLSVAWLWLLWMQAPRFNMIEGGKAQDWRGKRTA